MLESSSRTALIRASDTVSRSAVHRRQIRRILILSFASFPISPPFMAAWSIGKVAVPKLLANAKARLKHHRHHNGDNNMTRHDDDRLLRHFDIATWSYSSHGERLSTLSATLKTLAVLFPALRSVLTCDWLAVSYERKIMARVMPPAQPHHRLQVAHAVLRCFFSDKA
jgi:hypothetical protein